MGGRVGQSISGYFTRAKPSGMVAFGIFAPGSQGRMVGYLHNWPVARADGQAADQRPKFTYSAEFKVVEVSPLSLGMHPRQAVGVRTIYFHRDGARASFADPDTFARDDAIETDKVRLSFEFKSSRELSLVVVRMMARATATKPFEVDGRVLRFAEGRQDSITMFGKYSPQFDGWLLTGPDD